MNDFNYWINRIKKEFEGRELYLCKTAGIGGLRMNLNRRDISFCHEVELLGMQPKEVVHIADASDHSVDEYYEAVYNLLTLFQNEDFPCRKCSQCVKEIYHFEKIKYVTINPSSKCDNRCIYCYSHVPLESEEKEYYDVFHFLEMFHASSVFDPECYFDWGGGEPTRMKDFEKTVRFLMENGYLQRINTNAVTFSEAAYDALRKNRVIMRISPDSGTKEGFFRVKGNDAFEEVWDNIGRYCNCSDEVYIKYNIFNLNSDEREITSFVKLCQEHGVKHTIIDAEINSYQRFSNYGPFYFTEKELTAAKKMKRMLEDSGIDVEISPYSFRTRAEYDNEGKLKLPDKYYDNLDHNVLCGGNMIKAFSDFSQIIDEVNGHRLIVFGAGHIGEKAAGCLESLGIDFMLVDNMRSSVRWSKKTVINGGAYFRDMIDKDDVILIAVHDFKDILKQINETGQPVSVLWMTESVYSEYEKR